MPKHHFSRQNQRPRVDLILSCVLGRGAVSRLKDRDIVGQVGAGCDPYTTYLGRECIRDVVTIQIHGGQHTVLTRTKNNLLQHGICNHVFDHDVLSGVGVLDHVPGTAIERFTCKLLARNFIAPIAKGSFGKLHNVTFVHQRYRRLVLVDCILNRLGYQSLGALLGDWLDADTTIGVKANFRHVHLIFQEINHLGRALTTCAPLDTGINIL